MKKIYGGLASLLLSVSLAKADAINHLVQAREASTVMLEQPPPVVRSSQIQQIIEHWRRQMNLPGVALSLYLPGQNTPLTFISGNTAYVNGQPLTSNTLFQAGSITKSFTAMMILQLVAKGKLSLDDSITHYLPQYPQWQMVTIRELLNHTSGIFNYTTAGIFYEIRQRNPQQGFSPEQIVAIAAAHHNYFAPGQGWKYSNTNYVLAGMIINKVMGESMPRVMDEYLENHVKLHLLNTYYLSEIYSNYFLLRMAHGYNGQGVDVTRDNMSWAYTAGAIVTTTQDLLTWWRDLFQGHLLPNAQLHQMMSLVCEGSTVNCRAGAPMANLNSNAIGKGYGLGIIQSAYGASRLGTVWWHNGSTAGYKALVMWFPQSDIYMAITINRDPGYLLKPDLPIVRELMNALLPSAQRQLSHLPPSLPPIKHHKKSMIKQTASPHLHDHKVKLVHPVVKKKQVKEKIQVKKHCAVRVDTALKKQLTKN